MKAPFSDTQTSFDAALAIEPHLQKLERVVLECIQKWTALTFGITDERVSEETGLSGNTVRPRRGSLVEKGLVEWSGLTRRTKAGRPAKVWRIKK